jgi:hypothetical protein
MERSFGKGFDRYGECFYLPPMETLAGVSSSTWSLKAGHPPIPKAACFLLHSVQNLYGNLDDPEVTFVDQCWVVV